MEDFIMKMIIDGKAVDSSDGKVLNVLNPATGQVIDTVPSATEDDVNKAVSCAKEAQKIWAKVPVYEKVEILKIPFFFPFFHGGFASLVI